MSFKEALTKTLTWEGGYSNHKNDLGGETYMGLSSRFLKSIGMSLDNLTERDVIRIYYEHFWLKLRLDDVQSSALQSNLFDMGVNAGVGTATRLIQRACNILGSSLKEDGIMGPHTLHSINEHNELVLNNLYTALRQDYYTRLANKRTFLRGWLRRAQSFYKEVE